MGGDVPHPNEFRAQVLRIVEAIPYGRVLAYGDVATLAGSARAARAVAGILRAEHELLPWHRVVNRTPAVSPGDPRRFLMQIERLRSEGVVVAHDGRIDKHAIWPLSEAWDLVGQR